MPRFLGQPCRDYTSGHLAASALEGWHSFRTYPACPATSLSMPPVGSCEDAPSLMPVFFCRCLGSMAWTMGLCCGKLPVHAVKYVSCNTPGQTRPCLISTALHGLSPSVSNMLSCSLLRMGGLVAAACLALCWACAESCLLEDALSQAETALWRASQNAEQAHMKPSRKYFT